MAQLYFCTAYPIYTVTLKSGVKVHRQRAQDGGGWMISMSFDEWYRTLTVYCKDGGQIKHLLIVLFETLSEFVFLHTNHKLEL